MLWLLTVSIQESGGRINEFRFGKNGEIWTGKDDDILYEAQYI